MAKKRSRGGYRQPNKPAAVSGPGALSARTDGGAGSSTQPIRRIPGQQYGEGKALVEQQQAAPLPKDTTPEQPTQTRSFTPVNVFIGDCCILVAMEQIAEESIPPLRYEPISTSETRFLFTA